MAEGVQRGANDRLAVPCHHFTTRYVSLYKSQIQPHSRTRWSLKRQRLMSIMFSSTRTIKLPTGEQNSAPSYNNPLLSAHALSKRRPSGRGNNGQCCGKCGKSHEQGNCPAYGKTCDRCKGINHFKAVCCSKVTAKTAQSPHRSKKSQLPRRGSMGSYNGQGKGGGNRQHQKKTPKKLLKQNAYAVTMKKLGPIRSNNYIWW